MNISFELTFLNFSIQRETAVSQTAEVPSEQEKSFVKCTKRGKGDVVRGMKEGVHGKGDEGRGM